jgi:membrane-associated PAP2 superfamily phosphatase
MIVDLLIKSNSMNRQKTLHRFSKSFYIWQMIYLCLGGFFCFWVSRQGLLDHEITNFWFDPISHSFPLENNYWLELINHKILKYFVITIAVTLLLVGIVKQRVDFVTTAILIGLGSAAVGILKSTSQHSCPWDLVEYGGRAIEYPLLSSANYFNNPGHCFPGGHASGGFSLMALFFLFYPKDRKLAFMMLGAAIVLGQIMGFGQIVRGAHFLSHNLWSCWWVWLTQVSAYALFSSLLPHRYHQKFIDWCSASVKRRRAKA